MARLNRPDSLVYAVKGAWMVLRGNPGTIIYSLGLVIVVMSAFSGELKRTEKGLLFITIVMVSLLNWMNNIPEQLRHRFT